MRKQNKQKMSKFCIRKKQNHSHVWRNYYEKFGFWGRNKSLIFVKILLYVNIFMCVLKLKFLYLALSSLGDLSHKFIYFIDFSYFTDKNYFFSKKLFKSNKSNALNDFFYYDCHHLKLFLSFISIFLFKSKFL